MYGKTIKDKESLKYVDVVAHTKSAVKGIEFKVKVGASLKKAAQEVEEYLKSHEYGIQEVYNMNRIYFEYNNKNIQIASNWNSNQIGHGWMLKNDVDNEISLLAEKSADEYMKNNENKTEDKVLIQTEEERNKDPEISLLPLDKSKERGPKVSLLPLKLNGRKEVRLAKKQLKETAVVKNKKADQLNLEVKDGTSIREISEGLVKLFNSSSFKSASFSFNQVPVVARQGMTASDIVELYHINSDKKEQIIENAKKKQREIIEEYKTERAIEN